MPKGIIEFGDFQKLDLVVADILSAERVEGSDKLLKMELALGTAHKTVVAGIGKSYTPEEIKGNQVVCVANLASRVVMDIESEAMILAAVDGENVVVVRPDKRVPSGTRVS